jgi:hypothetical protein
MMAKPPTKIEGSVPPQAPLEVRLPAFTAMGRQGWIGVVFWMTLGLLLEGLLGYKIPSYSSDPQRRELFRLAHAHGTILSLLLVLAALWLERRTLKPSRLITVPLRVGTVLMPFGFLISGMWHFESDPGFAIWLVPVGALLSIFGVISLIIPRPRKN